MTIGQSLLTPYYRSKPTITITAIEITDEPTPKVKVFWSRKLENDVTSAGLAKGTIITTVPAALNVARVVPGSRREPSRLQAGHHLGRIEQDRRSASTAAFDQHFNEARRYYLRPRMSSQMTC